MKAMSTSQAPKGNEWMPAISRSLTATGSTQGTALAIVAGMDLSIFTTVALNTGAIMPAAGISPGEEYQIANHGANALSVYPALGGTMGTAATNAAYSLAAGKTGLFTYVGAGAWTTNP